MLAVVGALVALAVPAMRRSLAKSELRDAAGQLRVTLAKARLTAIETGAVQAFSYQPGSRRYALVSHPAATGGSAESTTAGKPLEEPPTSELADGILFLDPLDKDSLPVADDNRADGSAGLRVVDAKKHDVKVEWSRPVLFYPSGRATSARFRLLGQFDYYVDIDLRGLTGAVALGDVQRPKPKDVLDKDDTQDRKDQDNPDARPSEPQSRPADPDVAPHVPDPSAQAPATPAKPTEGPAKEERQ